jgi:hypothetical protein
MNTSKPALLDFQKSGLTFFKSVVLILDKNHIMACFGVFSRGDKEVAKARLIQRLGITVDMEINYESHSV